MRLGGAVTTELFFLLVPPDAAQREGCGPGATHLCLGLFSRFFVQALPCTAEEALCRVRDTRSLVLALTGRIDPTPTHHAIGWLALLASAGFTRIRNWPLPLFSTSKAPVLRTRSLSLLWP